MKGMPQALFFLIVTAFLAQTAITSVDPGFGTSGPWAHASPSDQAEEPFEEDGLGEDDKAVSEFPSSGSRGLTADLPKIVPVFSLLEHIPEIVVPPPQG